MAIAERVEKAQSSLRTGELIRNNASWIVLVIVVVFLLIRAPSFFTGENFLAMLKSASEMGLVAIGETFVILAGGFDLSVAAIMVVGGMVFGILFMNLHMPVGVAMLAALATTVGLGLVNGLLVTKVKLAAFIATFATMFVFTGASLALGKGIAIYDIRDPLFSFLGQGKLGPVPMPAIIFIVVAIIAYLLLGTSRFGRTVYAVGGNEKAAHMSGMNVDRTRLITYMISGFLSGLASLIVISRLEAAQVVATTVSGYSVTLLDAITAVMIGGISIFGGKGRMYGLIGGILLIQVLSNGIATLGADSNFHLLAKGLLIILAVGIDIYFGSRVKLRGRRKLFS
jgi:ribose transport system permease protein